MCGISGIWHLDNEQLREDKLSKFNNTLAHRGPDSESIFIDTKSNIGLGHRRLSILDLSDNGKQPMSYGDGRYTIVFNGEIYNFIELKKELEKMGYKFKSDSDTEIILASYMEWQEKCLDRFNGMWAFAIWDNVRKNIFVARDRFGVKPLYYTFIPKKLFAFSSETISFKKLDGYSNEIDRDLLEKSMRDPFALEGYGHTIYKNVKQILAGHFSYIDMGSDTLIQKRWWGTLSHIEKNIPTQYSERVDLFREIFEDACKIRLRSDVTIGTALSGGVDSSAIYCMVNKIMKDGYNVRIPENWQQAFVGVFKNTEYDEKKYADEVVRYTNGKAVYIEQNDLSIVDEVIESTKLFDGIYVSPISVVSNIYKSMRESGVKVSLDGHGVDEMLYGYRSLVGEAKKYLSDQISKEHFEEIFNEAGEEGSLFTNQNENSSLSLIQKIKSIIPEKIKSTIKKSLPTNTTEELIYLGEKEPEEENLNKLDKIIYDTFHRRTLPTILRNFDRASMQHGIEVRMPFMDWRLVSLVFSLPIEDKIYGGFTKRILRDSMQGLMPEDIRMRRLKIGLNAPMKEWFSGPLKPFLCDIMDNDIFKETTGKDYKKVRRIIEDGLSEKGWSWQDCATIWPYINAFILLNNK